MSNISKNNLKVSDIFQERLLDLVSNAEYNKKDLAVEIGISKDILIRATNAGLIPSPKSLIKIADYFDVSIEFLLGLTDNEYFTKSDNSQTFQARLNLLKETMKITSCGIATQLGFPRSLFATWKKYNYLPSLEILYSLSRFLKVNLDYILGRCDDKEILG